MKRINAIFFAATAAALSLASCSQENLAPAEKPQGELVTVHFGAESVIASTKATITTEDEKTFKSAWENGDVLSVEYMNDNGAGTVDATWQSSLKSFDAALPPYTGTWTYDAVYPAPASDRTIDFGSSRTQKGNVYNCMYDLMSGSAVAENAAEGKDDKGHDIIFEMDRQTAIAYFHLKTSGLDEDVVSATLSVEGDNAYIATKSAKLTEYAKGYELAADATNGLKKITIKFEGAAPKATDLKLWFNVLPTVYDKMTLSVETTGHTMSISRTSKEDTYEAGILYKVVKEIPADKWVAKTAPVAQVWHETALSDITADDEVVITMAKDGNVYALTSANGSSSAPTAVLVTVKDGELTADPDDALVWNISNDKGSLTIYPNGQTDSWLYSTSDNNGIRVGNNTTAVKNKLFIVDSDYDYLKNVTTSRYLGIYQKQDWRSYTSMHANISGQTLCFYVKGNAKTALETPTNLNVEAQTKTVSWDVVANAGSYIVTIGEDTFDTSTNSYDATAIEDEYYNVTVVAVPSDKDNFKNSAAAELKDTRFGTPKLNKPELKEGVVDENSINVTWTLDSRASEGYYCAIYNGEAQIAEDMVTEGSVSFNGLSEGNKYTIKVNALAVAGEKPYEASDIVEIKISTKAAKHVGDVTSTGTYTIKGLTVYAVMGTNNAIVGDGTGYILFYSKSSLSLEIGDTFDAAGKVVEYNGVFEYSDATVSNKQSGSSPTHANPVEATEDYLKNYIASSSVQYVHVRGMQSGKVINVGSVAVSMYAKNDATDGKYVDAYGYVYGYKSPNVHLVMTSITEDHSVPTLDVDKTSKTWASDETDAFVVNVTVNSDGGDWNVTPTSLGWAKVEVDKAAGTITVTPNGKNESDTANEATLTVTHVSDPTLTKAITLKQNAAGTAAETKVSTLTLSSSNKFGTTTGSTLKADDNVVWTVNTTSEKGAIQNSYQKSYYGQQFGISGTAWEGTFDADFSGKQISKIEVTANTGGSATISAKVGNSEYGKSVSVTKQTNKEVVYTFESVATGKISLVVSNTSKAFYLGKIKVTYTE